MNISKLGGVLALALTALLPSASATPTQAAVTDAVQQDAVVFSTPDIEHTEPVNVLLDVEAAPLPEPTYDWRTAIAAARFEVGTSRQTGWAAPGECIESARRWVNAGGEPVWTGSGTVLDNYVGATRHAVGEAVPGDIIQYHWQYDEGAWVEGVHTVLVTGVNADGTLLQIVESNNPAGSGFVSANDSWRPEPPEGFAAVAWRF